MASELDLVVARCETILAQCLVAANQAVAAAASIGAAGLAPLASPLFTGNPRGPTPAAGDSSDSLATTAFVASLLGQPFGVATLDAGGLVPLSQLPFSGLTVDGTWNAATNSPTLVSGSGVSGHFRVVTVSGTTNLNGITSWAVGDWALFSVNTWTKVPYTAPPISNLPLSSLEGIGGKTFVGNNGTASAAPTAISIASILGSLAVVTTGGSGLCPTLPGGTGVFLRGDGSYTATPGADLSGYAPLANPAFTGTATVSTQARNTMSSAIASTQFVVNQIGGAAELSLVKINGTTASGTSTYMAAIDHIHGTDTSRAAASNPSTSGQFTHGGSGTVSGTWTAAVIAATVLMSALAGTVTNTLTVNGTVAAKNLTVNGTATIQNVTVNGTFTGAVVKEANLSFTDVTTGNASASQHGLLPKLSGTATQFLNGTGGWSTPAAGLQTASQGLTVSGSDVRMNTNNSDGIGAYALVQGVIINDGVTFVSSGSENFVGININGGVASFDTTAIPLSQTWRNVSGRNVANQISAFLAIRVS